MDDFDAIPEWTDQIPVCVCGTEMRYNSKLNVFRCFNCGYEIDEEDWNGTQNYESWKEETIPFGCQACGGPWPECKTSCKLYD